MKKNISLALIFAIMLSSIFSTSVKAEKFSDMPENWAKEPIEKAISNGLLQGDKGKINPQGKLTRAELVTILNRALGVENKADLSNYTDVEAGKWYYNELAKGVKAGLVEGANGKLNPNAAITRQEAFVIVARALELAGDTNEHLGFKDGQVVANWATKEINGLIKNGYLKGNDGKINPKGNMTRAEFASLMNELVAGYVSKSGLYEKDIKGNLLVKSPNVELKGMKINGDLILAEGALANKTLLNGVEVTGRVLIRGGGELVLENNSKVNDVLVSNRVGNTNIEVDKTSQIAKVDLKTKADIKGEGKVLAVSIGSNAKGSEIATKDTKIDKSENIATKPEDKKEEKKDSGRSSGGGGGGGSSSGGSGSSNDKDNDKPVTPKPDEKEKITIKPNSDGNAVVRGNNLKEVILDGEFKTVTIDAPNAKIIVDNRTEVNNLVIKSSNGNIDLNGFVSSFNIETNKDTTINVSEGRKTAFKLDFKKGNTGKVFVKYGKNTPMEFRETIIVKVDNGAISLEDIKDEAVGVIIIELRDKKTGELIENVDLNLELNGKKVKPVHSNYIFWAEPGEYNYAINIPVVGISPSGMFTVIENESVSLIIEVELLEQPEITDRDRAINDINLGLDIINQMIEIDNKIKGNESLIMGGNK